MDASNDGKAVKEKKKEKKSKKSAVSRLSIVPLLSTGVASPLLGRMMQFPQSYEELIDWIISNFNLVAEGSEYDSEKQAINSRIQLSVKVPAGAHEIERTCAIFDVNDRLLVQQVKLDIESFPLLRDNDTVFFALKSNDSSAQPASLQPFSPAGYHPTSSLSHNPLKVDQKSDPSIIELQVQDDSSEQPLFFRYKRAQKLDRLMSVYCKQKGSNRDDITFTIRKEDFVDMSDDSSNVRDVHPTDTPDSLGLTHRATIHAKRLD